MRFVISDTHFGHENIIRYCDRPFGSAREMDRQLMERWNSVVRPGDTVYHLGDFSMRGLLSKEQHRMKGILRRLHGRKVLILGNHDREGAFMKEEIGFDEVYSYLLVEHGGHDGHLVSMVHRPYVELPSLGGDGIIYLCGHVHEKWRFSPCGDRPLHMNMSVEQWRYTPQTLDDVIEEYRRHIG